MKQELLGIRCGLLSERHRLWGECYMTDIDHAVMDIPAIEFYDRKCVALIEYKFFRNGRIDLESASIAAMRDLANRAGGPSFVVRYDPDDIVGWDFYVIPLNDKAKESVGKRAWMNEVEYVQLLHRLRGKQAPESLLEQLENHDLDSPIARHLTSHSLPNQGDHKMSESSEDL